MTGRLRTEKIVQMIGKRACTVVVDIYEPAVPRGTVFCLHGFIGNASEFEKLGPFLAENGVRAVCPDLLGRGRSAFLADPNAYGTRTHMETVQTLLKRFGSGQDSIVGSGGGAILALLFTRVANYLPRRLILADLALASSPALSAISQLLMELLNGTFDEPDAIDRSWREEGEILGLEPSQRSHRSMVRYLTKSEDGYRLACDRAIAFSLDNPLSFDISPLLRAIGTPVLLLYGRNSPIYDGNAISRIEAANPRVNSIAEFGAFDTVEFNEFHAFSTVLGFLSGKY